VRDRRKRAEKLIRHHQDRVPFLFIGGLAAESDGNATIQIANPTNGQPIGRTPAANVRDVERASEAAKSAYYEWSEVASVEKARILWRLADLVEAEAEDLAIVESLETGKTFREALNHDLSGALEILRHFAGHPNHRHGEALDLGQGGFAYTRDEPHPVVGAIVPWHAPLATVVRKIMPAIANGSTVVVKPAEHAPLTILRLAEIATEAGLPAGTINVVPGFGSQAGEALAMNKDVTLLQFAGSIETARRILVAAAKSNLKEVALELGGKSVNIVFEDADVRHAVGTVWKTIFSNAAAANTAASRLLVHETLYESLSTTLTARAKEVVLGDPLDEHTELGPMVSEEHMKRILAYVELGRREGAKLVAGGKRDVDGTRSEGFFVQPTVFIDVKPSMRIAQEEIGGPVLSIMPFKSEDEAVEIANATDYGLCAGIWTENVARAHRVARRMKAGVVWVNHYGRVDPSMPFGGVDLSGHGRDLGRLGLERTCRTKTIYVQSRS
jgi:acyl-CoA reductase-like NAD-dependent aldehyde dehydrogenase